MRFTNKLFPDRLRRPLRTASFRRLAAGKAISFLGDWLMIAALVGWIYETSHSVTQVATLMAIRFVPPILGGGVAAALVDRFDRRRVLLASELLAAATVGAALAGVVASSRPLVFAAAGLCALVAMVSSVAGNALVPAVVSAEELPAANAVYSIGQELAMAVGTLVGGLALALGGVALALAGNLVSYLVAAALYAGVAVAGSEPSDARTRGAGGLREGASYLRSHPGLLALIGAFALATASAGLVNATLPRFTAELGMGGEGYGIALAALAVGLIIGEAATGAATDRVNGRWLCPALAAMAACFLALATAPSIAVALVVLAAAGAANGVVEVVLFTALQQEADPAYHGRVLGLGSTAYRTTMLLAVTAAPFANALGSTTAVLGIAAAALLGAALVALRGPRMATTPASAVEAAA